jgi:hypothetical protein
VPWTYILGSSLFYGVVVTGYLFVVMISTSPRVWGYADYSEALGAMIPQPARRCRPSREGTRDQGPGRGLDR